jgi:serine/threonine protein kinase/WD40 repeat protein
VTDSLNSKFVDDPEFQSLLVGCLESLQRGETIDRDALAKDFPKYAEEIVQFLDDRELLENAAADFGDVSPSRVAISAYANTMDSASGPRRLSAGEMIRYIGEYEILEELARGGMGVVFKARQRKLNRIVALKMILAGRLADQSDVERFQREARAAGSLKHPNIVPVHEIGEHDGRHYFTMDFVAGRSLAEIIRDETLAPRAAAQLLRSTAQAVQYAHEQGTVHRDLKPGNVLLDPEGQPKVTDFGLAKMLRSVDDETRADLTASGQILGTPSYMSPEQAAGKQDLVGPASDIYSLGAVLYASLSGRAPFVADSPVDTLLQVMNKEPVSPRELNPSVPKDLETICLKCLNKEAQKRYYSAQDLADDLQRFLENRPVLARPVNRLTKFSRWVKRNPVVASLTLTSILLLVSGTAISSYFATQENQRAMEAIAAKADAIEQTKIAEQALIDVNRALVAVENSEQKTRSALREKSWHLYKSQLFALKASWEQQKFGHLQRLLNASKPVADEADFRGWEWYFFQDEVTRRFSTISSATSKFTNVKFSPDGKYLALRRADGAIEVRDVNKRAIICTIPGNRQLEMAWHPGATLLAAATRDHEIEIWDVAKVELLDSLATPEGDETNMSNRALAWSNDGGRLALGGYQRIDIWSWAGQAEHERTLTSLPTWISTLDWHPTGEELAAGGASYAAVIDVSKDQSIWQRHQSRVKVFDVEWDATGEQLATCWNWPALRIRIYDRAGKETELPQNRGAVTDLAWDTNTNDIVAANPGQSIGIWNLDSRSLTEELRYHSSPITGLDYHSDRQLGASVDAAGTVKVWSGIKPTTAADEIQLPFNAGQLEWDSRGNWIACGSDSQVCVCQLNRREIKFIDLQAREFAYLAWHPTQSLLAIQDRAGRVTVTNILDDKTVFDQQATSWDFNHSLAWSPDGSTLAAGSGMKWHQDDLTGTDLWDWDSGERILTIETDRTRTRVAWSDDSQRIAVASFSDRLLRIWGLADQELVMETSLPSAVWEIGFSPDGRKVAANLLSGPILIIDAASGKTVFQLDGHSAAIDSFSWSSDGSRLLTSSRDKTLRVWDAATGDELVAFGPEPRMGGSARWHPFGHQIATIREGLLCIWGTRDLHVPNKTQMLDLPQQLPFGTSDAVDPNAKSSALQRLSPVK